MNKYSDLEINILSCLLNKPELMEQVIVEDKHFIKHKKIWLFMKAFYNKFHNFDFTLMLSISKNKFRTMEYIEWLLEQPGFVPEFENYQKQLIALYEESKKEKYIIEKVYELANELWVRNIDSSEFIIELNNIYDKADEIFKND